MIQHNCSTEEASQSVFSYGAVDRIDSKGTSVHRCQYQTGLVVSNLTCVNKCIFELLLS